MGFHSRLSPSGAEKWFHCPGSVREEAAYPDEPTEWAAEGTVFHEIVADCLDLGMEPHDFVGRVLDQEGFRIEVTEDMADFAVSGLDFLRELPGEVFVERRVHLDRWMPGESGTLDVGIVTPTWIGVYDWKYGQGVPVYPDWNKQLMLYALGFWDEFARHLTDATRFRLFIEQPRIPSAGGEWECTLDELLEFGEEARAAAEATKDPDAPLHASEKACQFCKHRPNCDEFARFNLDLMCMKFDDLDSEEEPALIDLDGMTDARRAYVALHASMFRKWMEDLHSRVLHDALAGSPTPGLKAVPGRGGARQWGDPAAAEKILRRALGVKGAYEPPKPLSPTQAEKKVSTRMWNKLKPLVTQSEPKPILVPESDKREPIRPVTDLFDDDTDDLLGD